MTTTNSTINSTTNGAKGARDRNNNAHRPVGGWRPFQQMLNGLARAARRHHGLLTGATNVDLGAVYRTPWDNAVTNAVTAGAPHLAAELERGGIRVWDTETHQATLIEPHRAGDYGRWLGTHTLGVARRHQPGDALTSRHLAQAIEVCTRVKATLNGGPVAAISAQEITLAGYQDPWRNQLTRLMDPDGTRALEVTPYGVIAYDPDAAHEQVVFLAKDPAVWHAMVMCLCRNAQAPRSMRPAGALAA